MVGMVRKNLLSSRREKSLSPKKREISARKNENNCAREGHRKEGGKMGGREEGRKEGKGEGKNVLIVLKVPN